ncbi:MAG: DEAD/DEAH box helicase [bacterium]|nr:DEAD/DEAH box helicase [bacterium]
MTPHRTNPGTFSGLGIAPRLLDILAGLNFTTPTPIQEKAIPVAIEGKDVIGIAQTGTGKTLAFGIPMIQRIAQTKTKGLVVLPTRELALQVDEALSKVGRNLGLKTAVLIGGASMGLQLNALARRPHIIIGTPGRIIDHLRQKTLNFEGVATLVLDEADRMFDMGFAPQIRKILEKVPKARQTMLFSATMPDDIVRLATAHMKLPFRVEIARSGTVPEKVAQELFVLKREEKTRLLAKLLSEYRGSVLIFLRTKHGARKICQAIREMGHTVAELHSSRSLPQRRAALEGFKSGIYRVLVATDIASRGIDVVGIELVINYDIPENPGDYIHRIGRTGRAGESGRAISFVTREEGRAVRDIEKLLQTFIAISKLPELPPQHFGGYVPPAPRPFRARPRPPSRGFGRYPRRRY